MAQQRAPPKDAVQLGCYDVSFAVLQRRRFLLRVRAWRQSAQRESHWWRTWRACRTRARCPLATRLRLKSRCIGDPTFLDEVLPTLQAESAACAARALHSQLQAAWKAGKLLDAHACPVAQAHSVSILPCCHEMLTLRCCSNLQSLELLTRIARGRKHHVRWPSPSYCCMAAR